MLKNQGDSKIWSLEFLTEKLVFSADFLLCESARYWPSHGHLRDMYNHCLFLCLDMSQYPVHWNTIFLGHSTRGKYTEFLQ
jgi:hypothetical protein